MVPATEESTNSGLIGQSFHVTGETTSVESTLPGQQRGICERCEKDDLEGFLLGKYEIEELEELIYESSSFRSDCTLCVQIASLKTKMTARYAAHTPDTDVPPEQSDSLHIAKLSGLPCRLLVGGYHHWYMGEVHPTTIEELNYPEPSTNASIKHQMLSMNNLVEMCSVRYERIKGWVQYCESHHRESCCRSELQQKVEVITVIDCRTKCLKEVRSNQR
jgi:hypothetical protein